MQIEFEIGHLAEYGEYVAYWSVGKQLLGLYFLNRGEGLEDFQNELLRAWPAAEFVKVERPRFELGDQFAVEFEGASAMEKAVWNTLMKIPVGQVWDYSKVAKEAGFPTAVRAVASAIGRNRLSYVVPCHRVVRRDGGLGGYRFGLELKRLILKNEGVKI